MKSQITQKYKTLSHIFFWLSLLITILPVFIYMIKAFVEGTTGQKLSLGCMAVVAIILVCVNILFKMHLRSIIWILVLGIYIVIKNILPLLLIIAVGTILDEFVLTPLHKRYKQKATINAEIDKRIS